MGSRSGVWGAAQLLQLSYYSSTTTVVAISSLPDLLFSVRLAAGPPFFFAYSLFCLPELACAGSGVVYQYAEKLFWGGLEMVGWFHLWLLCFVLWWSSVEFR